MNLASVQTPADSAPLSVTQVLLAVAAMFVLALLVFLPSLIEAWKAAHAPAVVDLDAERMKRTGVPPQRADARPIRNGKGWSA